MSAPTFDALLGALVAHAHSETPAATLIDTRANILAASAATVRFGIASDTLEIFVATGSAWLLLPIRFYEESATPDMGYTQDSTPLGVYADAITDKRLSNVTLGNSVLTTAGGIRYNASTWRPA